MAAKRGKRVELTLMFDPDVFIYKNGMVGFGCTWAWDKQWAGVGCFVVGFG